MIDAGDLAMNPFLLLQFLLQASLTTVIVLEAVLACGPPPARGQLPSAAQTAAGYRDGARTGAAEFMSVAIRTFSRRFGATIALVMAAAALLAVWLGALSSAARASATGTLAQQISAGQNRVSTLSAAVGADNGRLRQLDAGISGLQTKIARSQSDLAAARAELLQLRRERNAARVRLAGLKAYERRAMYALSQQLVATYETDPPDLVAVVLDANGFSNLLERLSFSQRIRTHDQRVIAAVILARDRVAAQAVRLGRLEGRQQDVTGQVLADRDHLDAAKLTLISEQVSVDRARDKNVSLLTAARGQTASLRRQLARLQAAQAQLAAQASAAQTASGGASTVTPGGSRAGSDPIPGFTIERDDMGVDATASPGTGIDAPLASTLVQVLQDWYGSEPLLLFRFDTPPPGAPSDYWYVAEQIDPVTTAVGTSFQTGQRVASFASSGTGIEIGWGSATSDTRTLAGATDPAAASPPAGSTTSWGESFKRAFGIP